MRITANINRDKHTRNYKVRLFVDGHHQEAADYLTENLDEAQSAARTMVADAEALAAGKSTGNKEVQRKARIKDGIQTLLRKLDRHSLALHRWDQAYCTEVEQSDLRGFLAKKLASAKRKKYATQVGISNLLKRL